MSDVVAEHAPRDLGPAVRFPPPILFVAGIGLGALMSRWWPVAAPWGNSMWAGLAGIAIVVCGLALMLTGIITFRRAKVSVYPNRPARHLVTHGIYRFTRNPMYVGLTLAYLGGTLATGSLWTLAALPFVLLSLFVLVVRREERHLRERFPIEYANYCRRVRRWI